MSFNRSNHSAVNVKVYIHPTFVEPSPGFVATCQHLYVLAEREIDQLSCLFVTFLFDVVRY